jgi:hypothetical protein
LSILLEDSPKHFCICAEIIEILIQEDNDTSIKLVLSANGSAATQVFRVSLNVDFRFSIKILNFLIFNFQLFSDFPHYGFLDFGFWILDFEFLDFDTIFGEYGFQIFQYTVSILHGNRLYEISASTQTPFTHFLPRLTNFLRPYLCTPISNESFSPSNLQISSTAYSYSPNVQSVRSSL